MKSILLCVLISFIVADTYYTVVSGDNLTKIANKFGTTVSKLVSWNNIADPNKIYVGQRLIVKKDSNPTPTPTPSQPSGSYKVTDAQMKKMGWTNYHLADLNRCISKFNINTKARLRHFIAQTSHESGLGKWTQELGGTSYCSKYDGRKDLGNTQPGDGCKYKGAGYIQLTGRYNYQKFSNYIGDQKVMNGCSYVATNYPWTSAGYWWYTNGLNTLCDKGASVETITRKVNGGLNGLAERKKYYDKACTIF
jgi:predicted chitinase